MIIKKYHLQEQSIPDGFEIFDERLEVAGIQFRKDAAITFARKSEGCWLEFEREENNKYDNNAIRVIGCRKALFGTNRYFIGYVPKEISRLVVEGGFWGHIMPRLLKTYVGESGFVEILFQILGPKGKKYQYKQTEKVKGKHFSDYVDRVEQLVQEKKYSEAIELLLILVDKTEKEAKKAGKGYGVAPWFYEQLAIIYRKEKRYEDEVEILERFEKQPKSPGSLPKMLAERLREAKQLLNNTATNNNGSA
jgi:type I site-specific restriction-modification system R (restriction) subunit